MSRHPAIGWRFAATAMLCGLAATSATSAASTADGPALAERLDRLVRSGSDRPQPALAELQALPTPADASGRRVLALARAEILAQAGSAGEAAAALAEAMVVAGTVAPALAEADGEYLRALDAHRNGLGRLPAQATTALALYDGHCAQASSSAATNPASASNASSATPSAAASANPGAPDACEHRPRWRLHLLLGLHALSRHLPDATRQHGQAALALARAAADPWRQTAAECLLAQAAAALQERHTLRRHLEHAQALARRSGEAGLAAMVDLTEATTLAPEAGAGQARALMNRALAAAHRAGATRLEAAAWVNLSDLALREGRAAEALQATAQGLALTQPLADHRLGRLLEANAMLAQVRLGQTAHARQTLTRLLADWSAAGNHAAQLTALRQFGDALAATGDLPGALAMHHRERALSHELHDATRQAALTELRGRFDREAQQRDILMLERDNAVKAAALENRALTQRLWMLGGGALALALLLVLLLARRVRVANRALARNQRQLRHQSERDALTGLSNRRHAQAQLQGRREAESFRGGLLMLDIDHFKQINDRHGHAGGDAVLVQLAARLSQALGPGTLAARWGGEEFLIALPEPLAPGALRALARRLLQAVSGTPVALPDGTPLHVTTSIGHAGFPLPPHGLPVGLDQAINLVDMALYLAKAQGRHRAVGLASAQAVDADALRVLEADLEHAWREGQVQLVTDLGSPAPDRAGAAPQPRLAIATTRVPLPEESATAAVTDTASGS